MCDTLCLRTRGLGGRLGGLRLLWRYGDALSVVGDALVVCSVLLVALSSEAVGLQLRGACRKGDLRGCFLTLACD